MSIYCDDDTFLVQLAGITEQVEGHAERQHVLRLLVLECLSEQGQQARGLHHRHLAYKHLRDLLPSQLLCGTLECIER